MTFFKDVAVTLIIVPVCLVITLLVLTIAVCFSCRKKCRSKESHTYEKPIRKVDQEAKERNVKTYATLKSRDKSCRKKCRCKENHTYEKPLRKNDQETKEGNSKTYATLESKDKRQKSRKQDN